MGTLSKALAGMGAYVLTNSSLVIEYLTNNAGEYIYSTFLSPHQIGVALATIDIVIKANDKHSTSPGYLCCSRGRDRTISHGGRVLS